MTTFRRIRVALAMVTFAGLAILASSRAGTVVARTNWECDQAWIQSGEFEWCNQFGVHNWSNVGGGGLTSAPSTGGCAEWTWVGVDSWLSGDYVEDDGYDWDWAEDYAESSSNSESEGEFQGYYTLHTDHWYEGDPFTCGADVLEEDRTWTVYIY